MIKTNNHLKNKNQIAKLFIPVAVLGIVGLVVFYSVSNKNSKNGEQFISISGLSDQEISFLTNQGFLPLAQEGNEKLTVANLKSPGLVEQELNTEDERFEVLAAKLDSNNYQLAFKLENKSDKEKEFYLIPISQESQLEFKEVSGLIGDEQILKTSQDTVKEPLSKLYDIEKHKKELKPELAKAYQDIKENNYSAKPIKITLSPKSTLLAQSKWQISRGLASGSLEPVYFLVYGSAGGVKDDLIILNVHSSPQKGDNWEVSFITNGKADLKIIPNDQATIDDDEFVSLTCNGEERIPQILQGDVIYYPNWECSGEGKVVHYTKKAGKHTLKFEFGGQIAYAYNTSAALSTKSGLRVKGGLSIKVAASWTCGTDTIQDGDLNTYNTVSIGTQCWMATNLNYDGNPSTDGCTLITWVNNTDVGWCGYYTGGPFTDEGLLYQWSAATAAGLCPTGWHVPSDTEYMTLEEYLGMCSGTGDGCSGDTGWFRGTTEGDELKKSGLTPDICYDATPPCGTSGFNGLLVGYRLSSTGSFSNRGARGYFWSSTQSSSSTAWIRYLNSGYVTVSRSSSSVKANGFSVRCLKD